MNTNEQGITELPIFDVGDWEFSNYTQEELRDHVRADPDVTFWARSSNGLRLVWGANASTLISLKVPFARLKNPDPPR